MLSLALSLPLQSAAYAGIMATPLKATTSPATSAALFSAASLTLSSTFETEENQPEAMPTRLEVAAPPRALPKLKNDDSSPDPVDPISDLWTPKAPKGPKGPSVFKLNQGRAIDILRHDYPRLLTNKPDLTIFTENVEVRHARLACAPCLAASARRLRWSYLFSAGVGCAPRRNLPRDNLPPAATRLALTLPIPCSLVRARSSTTPLASAFLARASTTRSSTCCASCAAPPCRTPR